MKTHSEQLPRREFLKRAAQATVAGRIRYHHLTPFQWREARGIATGDRPAFFTHWRRGLFRDAGSAVADSGILHSLLELEDQDALLGHPCHGASWEGWCIEQLTAAMPRWRASFYRDSNGQEVDFVLERGTRRLAFEFKMSPAPELTRSGRAALELLKPLRTFLICPMDNAGYDVAPDVRVCGIDEALRRIQE